MRLRDRDDLAAYQAAERGPMMATALELERLRARVAMLERLVVLGVEGWGPAELEQAEAVAAGLAVKPAPAHSHPCDCPECGQI